MRLLKSVFSLAVTIALVSSYSTTSTFADSSKNEPNPEQVVTSYIKAIEDKNVDAVINLVKDTRYSSLQDLKQEYENMISDNVFIDIKAGNVKTVNESNAEVQLVAQRNDGLNETDITLPLIKEDGNWKILITGQETSRENVVKFSEFKPFTSSEIRPFSGSIAYYEFSHTKRQSGIGYHYTSYSTSSFDMNGRSVTINGWQENLGTTSDVSVKYSIVKKNLFGDDVKGDTTLTKRYPKDGTWYSAQISVDLGDSGISGVYLKTENVSSVRGADGAGNVYQI
ncbi:MAG: DUF4878 domain-containing protein [Paenibacillus macerans]|uniref:DUF4878 domain-containing protein n=1 Tax=Paenibacillus macerans TaxID=44252 RepID=UPI0029147C80|nr:DUF4878 domain-containing protein [Paenibacillus macerans]MDU7472318.1 DUF4878 domain-containing protein [Paenibacillus macerans]